VVFTQRSLRYSSISTGRAISKPEPIAKYLAKTGLPMRHGKAAPQIMKPDNRQCGVVDILLKMRGLWLG
jgi:hypothetical protein